MSKPSVSREPTFLWQGGLIVLPVLIMAVIGLTAILRDKAAVQQEARRRAAEVAQALAERLGPRVAESLAAFDTAAEDGPKPRELGAVSKGAFPLRLRLNAQGALVWPREYDQPPHPPAWFLTLSTQQRQAWDALDRARQLKNQPQAILSAVDHFLSLNPSGAARANAEFIRLFVEVPRFEPTNAVQRLKLFAASHRDVSAESGLPLDSLALAEALRLACRGGLAAEQVPGLLEALLEAPSLLTEELLRQVQTVLPNHPLLPHFLDRAWVEWRGQEEMREMARALRQACPGIGQVRSNFWIEVAGERWFCWANIMYSSPDTYEPTNSSLGQVAVYPKRVLERVFADAVRNGGVSVPGYFSVAVALASEPVVAPVTERAKTVADPVFAEVRGRVGASPGDSQPEFTVRVCLEQPAQLYAQQSQRTRLFGGLILASLLAALVGLYAAWRAFQRQRRLNELKSNFVSSVSHELRAPIASVRLMAESLERGKITETPKQREYFGFIVQECRRLSGLIENVLDFSRIEQGRKQYEFEPTNLVALVEQTVKIMETYAAERQVQLALLVAPAAATLQAQADGKALQQALVNLIDNAVKHSPKGETVTVGLEVEPSSTFRLWVEDRGPGIPVAEQEKIFERFYRLGSELRRDTQGVGIGLSIVKHIVEAHSGRVEVRSQPGHGSRFTLELPLKVWNES